MELVLAVLVLGVAEVVVVSFALRFMDRAEQRRAAAMTVKPFKAAQPSRFFADGVAPGTGRGEPLDALLLQLEHHVRLEQAAAESFLHNPTVESLHYPTASPLRITH